MSRLSTILSGFEGLTSSIPQPAPGQSRISAILSSLRGNVFNAAADAGNAIESGVSGAVSGAIKAIKGALPMIAGATGFGYHNDEPTFYSAHHHGVDTIAPAGSAIQTSLPFTVTNVHVGSEGGLQIYGKDPNGNTLRYLHLGRADVKIGDQVAAGQEIGTVGRPHEHSATELSTGPHNHFDIQSPEGKWINPETYSVSTPLASNPEPAPSGSRLSSILSSYS